MKTRSRRILGFFGVIRLTAHRAILTGRNYRNRDRRLSWCCISWGYGNRYRCLGWIRIRCGSLGCLRRPAASGDPKNRHRSKCDGKERAHGDEFWVQGLLRSGVNVVLERSSKSNGETELSSRIIQMVSPEGSALWRRRPGTAVVPGGARPKPARL